ncbi:MAG: permease [Candidatus Bathyarchaeota archaeon]|nr:permease [Candidatus Bathyarchaeota archaeon]
MKYDKIQKIKTIILLSFVLAIFLALVYSRIMAYTLAPTMKPASFRDLPLWYVPIAYIWDYMSHGWICLLFAFVAAGIVYEFIPKDIITKYMGSNKATGYALAAGVAPFFTVCSCTMIPLFSGILYAGAGIGPAIAFLLMAPAANILTILLTGEIISWQIAIVRIFVSLATAMVAGFVIANTPWGKEIENQHKVTNVQRSSIAIVKIPLDEKLINALKFSWYLAKQILPFFFVGLIAVGYAMRFLPEDIVGNYLTGFRGILIASVIGGPLYTPTLVEIVLGKGLLDLGMSQAALLSWLMGQPYDIPNMMAASKIIRWKSVLTYALIAWMGSVIFGTLYGIVTGGL